MHAAGHAVALSAGTKTCPYCAETVKAAAIRCRYCLSDLTMAPAVRAPATPAHRAQAAQAQSAPVVHGDGDRLLRLARPGKTYVRLEHTGRSTFMVQTVDREGEEQELLVCTYGKYRGTVVAMPDPLPVALQVSAEAAWSAQVLQREDLGTWDGTAATGTGDAVLVLPRPTRGLVSVSLQCTGKDQVLLRALDAEDVEEHLVIRSGRYRGQVRVPPGTEELVLTTSGTWTIALD